MNNIEAVVFDLDGVLRIGDKLTNGAQFILEKLEKYNIKRMIVTNECRYTTSYLKDELEEIGLKIPKDTLFYTAALSCKDYLEKKLNRFPDSKHIIGIVGELGLFKTINQLNKYNNFKIIDELNNNYSDCKIFLVIGAVNKIKITDLNKILKWIKKGAKVIVTCPDTTDPSSKGDFNLGMPNHMLYMVGYNILTKKYNTGKPNPLFKDEIMSQLEITDASKILFVGDTIYTDIQLAEESNFKSCLVLSGNSKLDTLNNYTLEPDYIINDVSELEKILSLQPKKNLSVYNAKHNY